MQASGNFLINSNFFCVYFFQGTLTLCLLPLQQAAGKNTFKQTELKSR